MAEVGKIGFMPLWEYRNILQLANDQIKKDMLDLLAQGKGVIMEHTLFKEMRWRV